MLEFCVYLGLIPFSKWLTYKTSVLRLWSIKFILELDLKLPLMVFPLSLNLIA